MKNIIFVVAVSLISICHVNADAREHLLPGLTDVVNTLDDYQVRIVAWSRLKDAVEHRILNLYYKRPGKLRLDVVEGSRFGDTGAVAIIEGDRVFARPGLKFVPFTLRYDRNNPRVRTIRDRSIDSAHINFVLADTLTDLASRNASVYIENDYCVFENSFDDGDSHIVERLYFDNATFLPRRYETYDNDVLVEHVDWIHFYLDQELPEKIFSTGFRARDMKNLVQAPLASVEVGSEERAAFAPGNLWSAPLPSR